jgi:hypothetical protein
MKTGIKHILIILALMVPTACSDWLVLIPPQGLIREEFWQSKEDVEAVVMGAYQEFASMDELLFKYGEIRADMVVGDVNQGNDDRKVAEGNIYSDNSLCNWNQFYTVIDYCNEVIKNAPEVKKVDNTFTDYAMNGYLSEVYWLRGLAYFYLVRVFGDVPYITEPTETDDTDLYVEKSDGEEILRKVSKDLVDKRIYATTDGYRTLAENKGRVTKAAYDALLADIALWLFDYRDCIAHVQRIEANTEYVLMPGSRWFELYYPGNTLESIYEFQFNRSLNQENSMYGLTNRNSYNYDPSPKAIESFRKGSSTRETVRAEDASIKRYSENDYIIWKYVGRQADGESVRTGIDQTSCNYIIYRLADVLLMKAEALSQLERFGEAAQILNLIRSRAGFDTPLSVPSSPQAYEDVILEERALELAFEGKRWFDLMRMGRRNNYARKGKLIEIIVANVPSTQKRILATKLTNPLGWYMPIYKTELERNKNLLQNPYYDY